MKVSDYPLIKTLIFFLLGFFVAYHLKVEVTLLLIILFSFTLLTIIFLKLKSPLNSLTISLAIVAFGCLIFSLSYYENEKEITLLDKLTEKKNLFQGYVQKLDYFDYDRIEFTLKCDNIIVNRKSVRINQKILVNLNLKDNSLSLNYFKKIISPGNYIRISGNLAKPTEPKFVGDFDQKFYLKSKDINYILYSSIYDDLNLIEENNSIFNFSKYLSELRQQIKFQIEQNFDSQTAAYIKGLFIAERTDIPEDIKEDFINSGVIHVLAVSGLHTGYIALILFALTGRLKRWLRLIFVAIGLFVFAHIANLSPSVVRASIMSVVVLLAMLIERKNSLLNSIALAALIILMINPLDIFNPGFQLSFAAVLSIALIYPALQKIFSASRISGWKRYVVDLLLISVAVSIGTFPFVAIYYQKFSFIALLANLIVIPLTGVILGGIILNLFVLNLIPSFFHLYKIALTELIDFNFNVVKFFAHIPYAYTSIKNFSTVSVIAYILMLALIIYIINKDYRPLLKFVFSCLLILNFVLYWDVLNPQTINPKENYLMLIKQNNSNCILIGDEKNNSLKFYEKSNVIPQVVNDLKRLDKILWKLDYDKIQIASFSTHSIWFTNHLRNYIDNRKIHRLNDKIWLFGYSFDDKNVSLLSNGYKFIKNSYTEIFQVNNWYVIVTPVDFNKLKPILTNKNLNLVVIKPNLDTLAIKTADKILHIFDLSFEKTGMKIFKLSDDNFEEIKWR